MGHLSIQETTHNKGCSSDRKDNFHEERPDVYVIAAGSLLERLLASGISFPVGRVEYIAMHPCSFLEFLKAMGEERLHDRIVSAPTSLNVFRERLLQLLNRYALIGGMPELIARYAAIRDVVGLSSVLLSLLEGYRDDSEKYATSKSEKYDGHFFLKLYRT